VAPRPRAGCRSPTACAPPLADALARAASAGLVTRVPAERERHSFAHALVRETLYEDLSPAERRRLHGEVGRALEDLRKADLEPHLAELASHFELAGSAGDVDKAIDYAARAARRAMRLHAYEEAAGHFERFCSYTPDPERPVPWAN
jgi:predicted ATPase